MKIIGFFVRAIWFSFMTIVVYITVSELVTNLIRKYRKNKDIDLEEVLDNV